MRKVNRDLRKHLIEHLKKYLRILRVVLILSTLVWPLASSAQFYGVGVTTQIIPPYSVYLPDYVVPGTEKLRLVVIQRDLTQASYMIRLRMSIEINGRVIMRTAAAYQPPPITLAPGVPTIISGSDLTAYLESQNIDFTGYSRGQYDRTKSIPEGACKVSFTAYDYRRSSVQVSDKGAAYFYVSRLEPPLVNLPACGSALVPARPQQVIFQWMPLNAGAVGSLSTTSYQLDLYEVRPQGRNPEDVVRSTMPIFSTKTEQTTYVYSSADPALVDSMQYAFRVRAVDGSGRDVYANNGYSAVCTFTWGGPGAYLAAGAVGDFTASDESERSGYARWTAGMTGGSPNHFDSYKVSYKKKGQGYQWFEKDTKQSELRWYDLEPQTTYECRVQGFQGGYGGAYSPVVTFTTPGIPVLACGAPGGLRLPLAGVLLTKPLAEGALFTAGDFTVTVLSSNVNEHGLFSGRGTIPIPYLGSLMRVTFEGITIDSSRQLVSGEIKAVQEGIKDWESQQLAAQDVRKYDRSQDQVAKDNQETYGKDPDLYKTAASFPSVDIQSLTVNANGDLVATDSTGHETVRKALPEEKGKDLLVVGTGKDQWVERKDGSIERIPGGGLVPPGNRDVAVTRDALNLIKKALKSLRADYSDDRLAGIAGAMATQVAAANKETAEAMSQVIGAPVDTASLGRQVQSTDSASVQLIYAQVVPNDNGVSARDTAFLSAERARLYASLVVYFADDMRNKAGLKLLAQNLKVGDTLAQTYITLALAAGTSEDEIVGRLKQEIANLLSKNLDENIYGP